MAQPDIQGNRTRHYFCKQKMTEGEFMKQMTDVYLLTAEGEQIDAMRIGISILGTDKIVDNLLKSIAHIRPMPQNLPPQAQERVNKRIDVIASKMLSIASVRLTPDQFNLFRQAF